VATSILPPLNGEVGYLKKRMKRVSWGLVIAVLVLLTLTATAAFFGWKELKATQMAQEDLRFIEFVAITREFTDFVQPRVNTIQFMHKGYSITFDSVEYTQDGLVLSGQVGNPTELWISSLALDMTARPNPTKIRDKWKEKKSPYAYGWDSDWDIGHAQTTVGLLNPGTSASFHITIPNVKQTSDELEIVVIFSGERYQYLGK
jgi:hypothetical protein